MQAEYYPFNQGPPVMMPPQLAAAAAAAAAAQQFAYGGYMPYGYPIGQTLPTHKNVEKLRRQKKSSSSNNNNNNGSNNNNASSDSRKFEEVTNSTDESIHLVRSRKTGGLLMKLIPFFLVLFYQTRSLLILKRERPDSIRWTRFAEKALAKWQLTGQRCPATGGSSVGRGPAATPPKSIGRAKYLAQQQRQQSVAQRLQQPHIVGLGLAERQEQATKGS
jgi:hypothetical protein